MDEIAGRTVAPLLRAHRDAMAPVVLGWSRSDDLWLRRTSVLAQLGNPYDLSVKDTDGRVGIDYGVYGVPETFLIDKAGVVRHQVVNDLPLGRNIDEMLRMVDALQFHEEHGEVCPAGWNKGKPGMDASPEGVAKYLAENADKL